MTAVADNRCPVCRTAIWAPDAETIGCKKCPRCGAELWAVMGSDAPLFFLRQAGESKYRFLAALAGPLYGVSTDEMEVTLQHCDSLGLVEVILEVEEAMKSGHR